MYSVNMYKAISSVYDSTGTFKLRFSTTRLLGLWLVRKEDRFPMDDDSAQWFASDSGLPRTSRLQRAQIQIERIENTGLPAYSDTGYSDNFLVQKMWGHCRNWLSKWARWWNITDQSQPNYPNRWTTLYFKQVQRPIDR